MGLHFLSLINIFFTKDEQNTIIFITTVFLPSLSIYMFVIITEKLNLNIASVDELISLSEIGPITAEKLIVKRVEMDFSSLLKTYCWFLVGIRKLNK